MAEQVILDTVGLFKYLEKINIEENKRKFKEILENKDKELILCEFVIDEFSNIIVEEREYTNKGLRQLIELPEYYVKQLFHRNSDLFNKIKLVLYKNPERFFYYRDLGSMKIEPIKKYFIKTELEINPADMGLFLSLKEAGIAKFTILTGDKRMISALKCKEINDYLISLGFEIKTEEIKQFNGKA